MHRIVGLDLGGDAIRLVALESGFRGFSVQEMAQTPLPPEGTLTERLTRGLAGLNGGKALAGDSIAVSLPGAQIASFPMTLPFTDARRIEQVLPAEIEGVIPFDLDDVIWDYTILSQEEGKSELLVAVVRKKTLKETLDTLQAAGLDPKVVTFGPLALAALGEKKLLAGFHRQEEKTDPAVDIAAVARGEQRHPVDGNAAVEAILEAGPERADFCILRDGNAEVARSLPTASRATWEAARSDPDALNRMFAPLVRDLKLTLRGRAGRKSPPQRLLLAGPLALLPGAAERLSSELDLPCELLQFAAGTQLPASAQSPEFDPAAHALALGLALRAQNPRGKLNFRRAEFAFTKDASQSRGVLLKLTGAFATVLVLAFFFGVAKLSALNRQSKAYDDALCDATQRVLKKCNTDWREALGALRGGNSRAAGIPRVGATEILAEVTQAFPEDPAPAIEDIEITTTRVTIKGTAESFTDATKVIDALKKGRCFGEIKQPRTDRVPNSTKVNFVTDFPYTCAESAGGQQ